MTTLTIVMAVYGQPLMLAKQLATIAGYPQSVRSSLRVIIVDDCGTPPVDPSTIHELDRYIDSATLFRVIKDIPWNQPGARNLAMKHAEGWCVMIDPDMVFSGEMIEKIQVATSTMQRGQNLRFCLRHTDTKRIDDSSPNTHTVHKDDFMAVAGYDEDFAGRKGYSDVIFARAMRRFGIKEIWRKDIWADFYGVHDLPDALVTTLDRSVEKNRPLFRSLTNLIRGRRPEFLKWIEKRKTKMIRFPWEQVYPTP